MYFRFINNSDIETISLESVSADLKIHLTRLLRKLVETTGDESNKTTLIRKNELINMAKTLRGEKIYVLESDDWGEYMMQEYAWHNGEFELIFRRLNSTQFFEFLGELLEKKYFSDRELNKLLEKDNSSIRFSEDSGEVTLELLPLDEVAELIEEQAKKIGATAHPNINVLIQRAESAVTNSDFSGVLHSCASIFETLSKDVIAQESIENSTLGSYIQLYKKESNLPTPIVDYIKSIYDERNKSPLAGHGSTKTPALTAQEAITLLELTKAFVQSEYRLNNLKITKADLLKK